MGDRRQDVSARRAFLKAAAGALSLSVAPLGAQGQSPRGGAAVGLRAAQPGESILVCGGDWFLTRRLSPSASPATTALFDVFRGADAGFANLENGLSTVGSGELGGFRQGAPLRGDPALAPELAWAGVRAVSLANNHTGNYGREALLETIAALDRHRLGHAGAGASLDAAAGPALVRAGGLTVAFFSVYTLYDAFSADDQATASAPGVNVCRAHDVVVQPQDGFDPATAAAPPYIVARRQAPPQTIMAASSADVARLKAAIGRASSQADFTLLSVHVHWGRHTRHDLPPNLRAFAYEMIDAGVDLFVGHGPHAIRGVEVYRGKPIVHSMGNLVLMPANPGAAAAPERYEGVVVRAAVAPRQVRALEFLPIAIDVSGDPRMAEGGQAAGTLGKLAGLSAALGLDIPVTGQVGRLDFA
jgi:poly-gamma-glutamate synthesis protein (capsule biosynthesis protein)